jgi:tyrosyl-tRNA synthetase
MQDVIATLAERGFLGQLTDPALREVCNRGMIAFYVGFDPTADSLHIGSLKQIMMMAQFQRHEHRPIVLVGGGTGMIGDPSGKAQERQLLSREDIQRNLEGIKAQLARFLEFKSGPNSAIMVNNFDWLGRFSFIDFLRDVGKYFRVGEMLGKESVRARIASEEGMSFTEFCYQLLQAYDFLYLFDHHHCVLQMGGSDQWGNITAGIDLIRKLRGKVAYGLTTPLVVTATGQKFGKTEAGTIWLSAERTSPYEFYQYWVRTDDRDVIPFLKIFTFLPLEEIVELEAKMKEHPEKREAQNKLALEVTRLVHPDDPSKGESISTQVVAASGVLFGKEIKNLSDRDLAAIFKDVPGLEVARGRLAAGIALVDLMAEAGMSKSKGEARRAISGGGVYLNNNKVAEANRKLTLDDLASETMLVLRSGKKNYLLVKVV